MTNLSPAAQAVLDAVAKMLESEDDFLSYERDIIAAALCAAADQVVPEHETTPGGSKIWPSEPVLSIRAELLAIAAELESAQ